MAINHEGALCEVTSPRIAKTCMAGAIARASIELGKTIPESWEALGRLADVIAGREGNDFQHSDRTIVTSKNDSRGFSKIKAVNLLKKAAK